MLDANPRRRFAPAGVFLASPSHAEYIPLPGTTGRPVPADGFVRPDLESPNRSTCRLRQEPSTKDAP
jgi:hypothetical protein